MFAKQTPTEKAGLKRRLLKMPITPIEPFIVECATAEEANRYEQSGKYRLERYSESRSKYIMIRRRD